MEIHLHEAGQAPKQPAGLAVVTDQSFSLEGSNCADGVHSKGKYIK